MNPDAAKVSAAESTSFTAADVLAILYERGWLSGEPTAQHIAWCARAASLLSPHAADGRELSDLLGLIFHYHAGELMAHTETHVVLSRYAARDVLGKLALLLLDGQPLTVDRFKEIVDALKLGLDVRGRELFHPLRLALAGRAGEGQLDRVILLLDEAAALPFGVTVKSARARIIEFCAALD